MNDGEGISIRDDPCSADDGNAYRPGGKMLKPGAMTKDSSQLGRRLSWEEASERIGQMMWFETILSSGKIWKIVIPEKYMPKYRRYHTPNGPYMSDRLMLNTGADARSRADEYYCRDRFYELKGSEEQK